MRVENLRDEVGGGGDEGVEGVVVLLDVPVLSHAQQMHRVPPSPGFAFRNSDFRVRVHGLPLRAAVAELKVWDVKKKLLSARWFRFSGLRVLVSGFGIWVSGLWFRVSGFGVWVSGFWFRVCGLWIRVSCQRHRTCRTPARPPSRTRTPAPRHLPHCQDPCAIQITPA